MESQIYQGQAKESTNSLCQTPFRHPEITKWNPWESGQLNKIKDYAGAISRLPLGHKSDLNIFSGGRGDIGDFGFSLKSFHSIRQKSTRPMTL